MKRVVTLSYVLLLPFLIFDAAAQFDSDTINMDNLSAWQTKRMAKKLEKRGSNFNALDYWEEYYERKPEKHGTLEKIAELNFKLRDYKTAEQYYKTLVDSNLEDYPKSRYYYALMLKYNGKYDESKQQFQTFIDRYLADDSAEFIEKAKKEMEGIDLAKRLMEDELRVNIVHLDEAINNPYTDYAPVQMGEALYYSSIISDSVLDVMQLRRQKVDYYSKVYVSTSTDGTDWVKGTPVEGDINSSKAHAGNAAFSPDGTRMYFTRCKTKRRSLKMNCDIYVSKKTGEKWGDAEKLENVNGKGNDTQPNIGVSQDGKDYLYFVSDREGGVGGTDIWFAESTGDGGYGTPVNAGATINSTGDESTPFFNNTNKTLYFSSNGWVNIGGADIFSSKGSGGQWDEPVNFGYPINSSVDDMYFTIDGKEEAGFFVSNRPSRFSLKSETSGDDIYRYNIIKEILLDAFVALKNAPEVPVGDADVSVFTVNGETLTLISTFKTDTAEHFVLPLDPEKTYQVNATKPGYWGAEEVLKMAEINVKDTLFRAFLIEEIRRRKIKLKRIYYEFDRYNVTREYKVTLDSLFLVLTENPAFTLEIIGHTDSVGTDEYNVELGKRRAQSAADYLMNKGITENRLTLSTKGEEAPLLPNTTEKGKDDPKARAKNRRVEFKVSTNDPNLEIEIEYLDNPRQDVQ